MKTQLNYSNPARVTFFFLMLFFSCAVFAGEVKVPVNAIMHIQNHYPGAKNVKYFMEVDAEGKKHYEIRFRYKGDNFDLSFDDAGQVFGEEWKIDCATIEDSVHQRVFSYLNSNFKCYHIYRCKGVAAYGDQFLEISIRGKRKKKRSVF